MVKKLDAIKIYEIVESGNTGDMFKESSCLVNSSGVLRRNVVILFKGGNLKLATVRLKQQTRNEMKDLETCEKRDFV